VWGKWEDSAGAIEHSVQPVDFRALLASSVIVVVEIRTVYSVPEFPKIFSE